jgi:MFS family permease
VVGGSVKARQSTDFSPFSLDAVNFLLADVRGALGPYLNVFLVTQQHWSQAETGLVTMIGGLVGIAGQTPIGAAIDETRAKRGAIVFALAVLALGGVTIFALPMFWPVIAANSLMAIVGDVFGPAVAALTLGLYAREKLAGRMGRNSAFDHAGNVDIAVIAGAVGYVFSQRAVFLLVPLFAVLAGIAVLSIPYNAINLSRARDLDGEPTTTTPGIAPAGYGILFKTQPLVIYGLCVMLFHFANAPLLPLVGQKLAAAHQSEATAMMSACIIAAQLVMVPIAVLVGRTADSWGRKPLFLVGFGILPIRAVLYTFSDNSAWLIGVQLLDGVGAGVFGALSPLVIADIMRGTGRYNLAQGAIATAHGIGASISGFVAGLVVDYFGYSAAFLTLAVVAAIAFAVLATVMPETMEKNAVVTPRASNACCRLTRVAVSAHTSPKAGKPALRSVITASMFNRSRADPAGPS